MKFSVMKEVYNNSTDNSRSILQIDLLEEGVFDKDAFNNK